MNIDDIIIIDTVSADTIEVGDQVIIEGDHIEVTRVSETEDIDEVVISGFSHISGDSETYALYADDTYEIWSL